MDLNYDKILIAHIGILHVNIPYNQNKDIKTFYDSIVNKTILGLTFIDYTWNVAKEQIFPQDRDAFYKEIMEAINNKEIWFEENNNDIVCNISLNSRKRYLQVKDKLNKLHVLIS